MALLVLFGKEPLTLSLVIACLLTSLGVFVSGMDSSSFKPLAKKTRLLVGAPPPTVTSIIK
jgi:hypothetical protein